MLQVQGKVLQVQGKYSVPQREERHQACSGGRSVEAYLSGAPGAMPMSTHHFSSGSTR